MSVVLAALCAASGACLLVAALWPAVAMARRRDAVGGQWLFLSGLIVAFVLGDMAYLLALTTVDVPGLKVVSVVLLGGGVFVFTVTHRALSTVSMLELAASEERARSLQDPLTGLPNRLAIHHGIDGALAAREDIASGLTVLSVLLHHIRDITRVLGHSYSDPVVQQAATRLVAAVDTAGEVGYMADEEFVVICSPDVDEADLLSRIRGAFSEPLAIGERAFVLSPTVGIARYPEHAGTGQALLRQAGAAASSARLRHEGSATYDASADHSSSEDLHLVTALRESLRCGRGFWTAYQPQVDLVSGQVVGVEALLRWRGPQGSQADIPPSRFIPLAEESGLIWQLTYMVVDRALRDLARWRGQGHQFKVSVNLSPQCLADKDLAQHFGRLLRYWRVAPEHLVLEITESTVMSASAAATEVVRSLRKLGIAFSIDDFGTGYASFSYLKKFPANEIKLDRSFVLGLPDDANDSAIVAAAIGLAHQTDRRVVAEGIESARALIVLRSMGCDVGQGYFLCAPLQADALDRWLLTAPTHVQRALGEERDDVSVVTAVAPPTLIPSREGPGHSPEGESDTSSPPFLVGLR